MGLGPFAREGAAHLALNPFNLPQNQGLRKDYSADMFSRFQQAVQSANSDLDTAAQIVHHA